MYTLPASTGWPAPPAATATGNRCRVFQCFGLLLCMQRKQGRCHDRASMTLGLNSKRKRAAAPHSARCATSAQAHGCSAHGCSTARQLFATERNKKHACYTYMYGMLPSAQHPRLRPCPTFQQAVRQHPLSLLPITCTLLPVGPPGPLHA